MKPIITVNNLSKVYQLYNHNIDRLKEIVHPARKKYHQDFYALKNISFEVTQGEIVGIVGKNGSGKSTLLKIITGVTTPTFGSYEINGKISALIELGAGFNPEYTGIENIYLNGTILGYSKKMIDLKLDEILSFADIGDYVYQPVKTYSSGMLVRLAFSVAITVDPDILIVDEALSVGDALFQRKCYEKINSFIDNGKTVLFVSHSLNIVTQLCNRAVLLDAGEIILDAKPKLVHSYYTKLLYTIGDGYLKTRKEIIDINQDKKTKANFEKEQINNTDFNNQSETLHNDEISEKNIDNNDFYLPDFKSLSMVQFKKYDIDIYDICLKNLNGEIVNHINTNKYYTYSYKVKFNITAFKVTFGMMIKLTTGFIVSQGETPGKFPFKYIEQVSPGEILLVDWSFKCNLLPGTYYTNAGVIGIVNQGQRDFLNRVMDAYVFKVQNIENNNYQGVAYLEQHAEIRKLSIDDSIPQSAKLS